MSIQDKVARALNADFAKQWNAQPLPGPCPEENWSATCGDLNLSQLADAAVSAHLAALQSDEATVARVARAICTADETAPEPDASILIGMREAKAWEGRIEMARAALAAIAEESE